jgi:Organic Anion Transporter Polypeptide (OATP) family
MVLFAIASFGCTLPHFIFGDELMRANNVFNNNGNNPKHFSLDKSMVNSSGTFQSLAQMTDYQSLCFTSDINGTIEKDCKKEILVEQAAHTQLTTVILAIFVLSMLGVGIGQTAVSTLGIPYIDDNVASRESPIYIGKI